MKRNTQILALTIAFVSSAILAASMFCTWEIAHGASMKWRLAFRALCHGIPSRCLYVWNVPMPICARCAAIYAGLIAGILFFLVLPRIEAHLARKILAFAAAPMFIDGLSQLTGLRESTNLLRIETGLLAGIAFTFWALSEVESHVLSTA